VAVPFVAGHRGGIIGHLLLARTLFLPTPPAEPAAPSSSPVASRFAPTSICTKMCPDRSTARCAIYL
jgi:hypothetical protein